MALPLVPQLGPLVPQLGPLGGPVRAARLLNASSAQLLCALIQQKHLIGWLHEAQKMV